MECRLTPGLSFDRIRNADQRLLLVSYPYIYVRKSHDSSRYCKDRGRSLCAIVLHRAGEQPDTAVAVDRFAWRKPRHNPRKRAEPGAGRDLEPTDRPQHRVLVERRQRPGLRLRRSVAVGERPAGPRDPARN